MRYRWVLILICALGPTSVLGQTPAPDIKPDTSAAASMDAMKAQLRTMAAAQAQHFARHKKYATNLTPTRTALTPRYVIQISAATTGGWSAVTTAVSDSTLHCGIYEGSVASPNAAVTEAKTPACWHGPVVVAAPRP